MAEENKTKTYEIEQLEERVVLVGVSERDGDDAEDSLVELAELVKTAGATVKSNLIPLLYLCSAIRERPIYFFP